MVKAVFSKLRAFVKERGK